MVENLERALAVQNSRDGSAKPRIPSPSAVDNRRNAINAAFRSNSDGTLALEEVFSVEESPPALTGDQHKENAPAPLKRFSCAKFAPGAS